MDSLWSDLANDVASLTDAFDANAVLDRQEQVIDAAWELGRVDVRRTLPRIVTPLQLSLLPGNVRILYEATKPVHMRSYHC